MSQKPSEQIAKNYKFGEYVYTQDIKLKQWNYQKFENNDSWVLLPCFDLLLNHGIDPNSTDNFGESLLNFTIRTFKM